MKCRECRKIERHIHAYLALRGGHAGAAEPPFNIGTVKLPFDIGAFESHLRSCSSCRARLLEWEGLEAALDGLPRVDPPRDLAGCIIRRIRARRNHVELPGFWRLRGLSPSLWGLRPRVWGVPAGAGVCIDIAFSGAALAMFLLFMWSALGTGALGDGTLIPHAAPLDLVRLNAARVTATLFSRGQALGKFGAFLPRLFSQGAGFMANLLRFGGFGFGG